MGFLLFMPPDPFSTCLHPVLCPVRLRLISLGCLNQSPLLLGLSVGLTAGTTDGELQEREDLAFVPLILLLGLLLLTVGAKAWPFPGTRSLTQFRSLSPPFPFMPGSGRSFSQSKVSLSLMGFPQLRQTFVNSPVADTPSGDKSLPHPPKMGHAHM